jgi:hypothetical protein
MEEAKQFGKREMFYNVQRQMLAIEKKNDITDRYLALKKTMVSLETMLQIEEQIHGIAIDYMIDDDIVKHSKAISNMWLQEVGAYKEE